MKVFISQPMNGLTDEEILKARNEAIEKVKEMKEKSIAPFPYNSASPIEVLETFAHPVPENINEMTERERRLYFLGLSIQLLGKADLMVLCPGWETAKGCCVELRVAELYGVPTITLENRYQVSVE